MTSAVTLGRKIINLKSFEKLFFSKNKKVRLIMDNSKSDLTLHNQYIGKIKEFIPELTSNLHKGECGRIGLIGGSAEYTGAPYFAAMSSLKAGADLVYVFCSKESAGIIKSYSPELIVLPILDGPDASMKIEPWLSRLHALVIGPGLGREPGVLRNVGDIIIHCSEKPKNLPLIIDADGLFLISENPALIQNYRGPIILTPNTVEYSRLSSKYTSHDPLEIAGALNAVILQKGLTDVITNGIGNKRYHFGGKDVTIKCQMEGSFRRCGGQGDILSGCLGTFVAWFQLHKQKQSLSTTEPSNNEEKLNWFKNNVMGFSWACYGACAITKTCNALAFEKFGRSMTASDMIPFIHQAFESLFGP